MPAGRPSKYKPEYCEAVIALMGQGFSKTAFAGSIGVSRQRLIDWAEANPEFRDAIDAGVAGRVFFLETGLLEAKNSQTVTSRVFALKNADPEEWREKQEITHQAGDTLTSLLKEIDGKSRGLPPIG